MNKMVDNVNHPKHYTKGKIEPIDFINANDMDYLEGNIIKYISRYKYKSRDKSGVEDLEKAEFYLRMLIQREKEEKKRKFNERVRQACGKPKKKSEGGK